MFTELLGRLLYSRPVDELARLSNWWFDFRHGTDTLGVVPCTDYENVIGDNKSHGTGFESTRSGSFQKVIRSTPFPPGGVFVDIGSGKGRMLLIASDMGFRKCIGIEFVTELCEIARKNVEIWRSRGRGAAAIEIYAADASVYEFSGEENVFFFSNPFDGELMSKCLDNISRSLAQRPRPAWIIYMNPREHRTIEACGIFTCIAFHKFVGDGRNFRVYSHTP